MASKASCKFVSWSKPPLFYREMRQFKPSFIEENNSTILRSAWSFLSWVCVASDHLILLSETNNPRLAFFLSRFLTRNIACVWEKNQLKRGPRDLCPASNEARRQRRRFWHRNRLVSRINTEKSTSSRLESLIATANKLDQRPLMLRGEVSYLPRPWTRFHPVHPPPSPRPRSSTHVSVQTRHQSRRHPSRTRRRREGAGNPRRPLAGKWTGSSLPRKNDENMSTWGHNVAGCDTHLPLVPLFDTCLELNRATGFGILRITALLQRTTRKNSFDCPVIAPYNLLSGIDERTWYLTEVWGIRVDRETIKSLPLVGQQTSGIGS